MKLCLFAVMVMLVSGLIGGEPASAQTAPAQTTAVTHSFTKDTVIYVSDFELDAQNVDVDKGRVIGQNRPGLIERPRKREQGYPQAQAKKLVNVMAENPVSDLQKAGFKA